MKNLVKILIAISVLLSISKVEAQERQAHFGMPFSYNLNTESPGTGIEIIFLNKNKRVGFGMIIEGFSTDTTFYLSSASISLPINLVKNEFMMPLYFGVKSIPGIEISPTFGFGGRYIFSRFYVEASGHLSYLLGEEEGPYFSKITIHLGLIFGKKKDKEIN